MIVFVDFDGTITDIDAFDALVRDSIGDDVWDRIDADLVAGHITLRDGLALQASYIRKSKAQALEFFEATAVVDPTFRSFVETARSHGVSVHVVSSGIRQIIEAALSRAGLDVPVFANDVDFETQGWTMTFIDGSDNGHDKAARVRAARAVGEVTIYAGDGISDFAASHEADRCFAKAGSSLERYCRAQGIAVTPFTSFEQIGAALFSPAGTRANYVTGTDSPSVPRSAIEDR